MLKQLIISLACGRFWCENEIFLTEYGLVHVIWATTSAPVEDMGPRLLSFQRNMCIVWWEYIVKSSVWFLRQLKWLSFDRMVPCRTCGLDIVPRLHTFLFIAIICFMTNNHCFIILWVLNCLAILVCHHKTTKHS